MKPSPHPLACPGPASVLLALVCAAGCRPDIPQSPLGDEVGFRDASDELGFTVLTEDGGRVDWSHALDLIAFDRIGDDGYADVWVMAPDGSGQDCLTCGLAGLPQKHNGQPAWHPSGEYLVFQSQRGDSGDGDGAKYAGHPGRGVKNDLWALHLDTGELAKLTDIPNVAGRGVLHPHFARDGALLLWSEMVGESVPVDKRLLFGDWQLNKARWSAEVASPSLEDVQVVTPGTAPAFYESHGASPDDTRWIFSANLDPDSRWGELNDIYTVRLDDGGDLRRLTTHGYNEHAAFSPDGARILWMSNAGNEDRGTDYWSMSPEGGDLVRLTRLRDAFPGVTERIVAADVSFSPDGERFLGYLHSDIGGAAGSIVLFDGFR